MKATGLRALLVLAAILAVGGAIAQAEDEEAPAPATAPKVEMVPGQDWSGRPISGEEREWMRRSDRRFPAETTERVLREAAAELPSLSAGAVLSDRSPYYLPKGESKDKYSSILARVQDPRHEAAVLARLSRDDDPRVTLLAIVSLFSRDDPHQLPIIAERLTDDRQTIPGVVEFHGSPGGGQVLQEYYAEKMPQTVGYVARSMIEFYLRESRHPWGRPLQNSFQHYWSERKDRDECMGWLRVRLARAKHGFESAQPGNLEALMLLYDHINRLPDEYRELALIDVLDDDGIFRVARPGFSGEAGLEQQLVYAARRLYTSGHLLPLMEGTEDVGDPDWNPFGLTRFVMRHADEVLRPADADELLEWRERLNPGGVGDSALVDWLTVGVARLRPERAVELLVPLLKRGGIRDLGSRSLGPAIELWRLCGSAQTQPVLDWFYGRPPAESLTYGARQRFLELLFRRFNEEDRRWLAAMLLDKRFGRLPWKALRYIAGGLNRNVRPPVLPPDEMDRARKDWLEDLLIKDPAAAKEKYPEEASKLLAILPDWQKRICESIARWAPGSAGGKTEAD